MDDAARIDGDHVAHAAEGRVLLLVVADVAQRHAPVVGGSKQTEEDARSRPVGRTKRKKNKRTNERRGATRSMFVEKKITTTKQRIDEDEMNGGVKKKNERNRPSLGELLQMRSHVVGTHKAQTT